MAYLRNQIENSGVWLKIAIQSIRVYEKYLKSK